MSPVPIHLWNTCICDGCEEQLVWKKLHEDLRGLQDSFSTPLTVRLDLWGQTTNHPDTQEYDVTGYPHPHPLHLLHRGCRRDS